jgi:hypothetical protein
MTGTRGRGIRFAASMKLSAWVSTSRQPRLPHRHGRPCGSTLTCPTSTSMLGYSGFLLGPPAIGFLASEFGLRMGLTTLAFLALAAAAIAYHKRNLLSWSEWGRCD